MSESKPVAGFELPPALTPLAPALMMAFWMLLGAPPVSSSCRACGDFSVGLTGKYLLRSRSGATGAIVGAVLGRIKNPRLLVLLMAVFARAFAGGVAEDVAWGVGGQVVRGTLGGLAWATWLFVGRHRTPSDRSERSANRDTHDRLPARAGMMLPEACQSTPGDS